MSSASYDYDLFVIGAGSGGVRAARISAAHGARVAVAECDRMGGTCVNVGCVPKKLFVYGAHYSHDFEDAAAYGWDVAPRNNAAAGGGDNDGGDDVVGKIRPDWPRLIANKDAEIERLNGVYQRILENAGVQIVRGRAALRDRHTVAVGDRTYTAKYILLAVGGHPNMLGGGSMPGAEHCISSDDCFYLKEAPRSVLIVGGGYIATEFANIFNGYRSRVTQIYRGPLFLRGFDDDVRNFVAEQMREQGVDLRFEVNIDSVEAVPDKGGPDGRVLRAKINDGSIVTVDQVLLAIGRHPNVGGLGLEAAGVEVTENKGVVPVDRYSRTNVDNIYAIGDVTDRINLTPVAIAEGHCFADTLFGGMDRAPDHEYVPSAVFCNPPIGTVGMTEQQARKACEAVDIYRTSFRALKHTMTKREERTMMKLVVDRPTQRVVGAHMVADAAGEMIQAVGVAVKMGAKKSDFDACIGVHPTSAEELVTMRSKVNED